MDFLRLKCGIKVIFTLVPHFFLSKVKKSWLKKNIKYDKTTLELLTSKKESLFLVISFS